MNQRQHPKPPSIHVRAFITWLAIFPLVTLGVIFLIPALGDMHPVLKVLILTLILVPLAVYLIVPWLMKMYMKLAARGK